MKTKRAYFDVETTGLDPEKSAIYELAYIFEVDGEITAQDVIRIAPFEGAVITAQALSVRGLSEKDLTGVSYQEAYRKLISTMETGVHAIDRFNKTDKFHFVAYNAKFDYDFIRALFSRNDDKYFGSYFWHPYRDIMQLAAEIAERDRPVLPNFKLETLSAHFCLSLDAHKAESDIWVTREIHKILRDKITHKPPQSWDGGQIDGNEGNNPIGEQGSTAS